MDIIYCNKCGHTVPGFHCGEQSCITWWIGQFAPHGVITQIYITGFCQKHITSKPLGYRSRGWKYKPISAEELAVYQIMEE